MRKEFKQLYTGLAIIIACGAIVIPAHALSEWWELWRVFGNRAKEEPSTWFDILRKQIAKDIQKLGKYKKDDGTEHYCLSCQEFYSYAIMRKGLIDRADGIIYPPHIRDEMLKKPDDKNETYYEHAMRRMLEWYPRKQEGFFKTWFKKIFCLKNASLYKQTNETDKQFGNRRLLALDLERLHNALVARKAACDVDPEWQAELAKTHQSNEFNNNHKK